MVAKRWWNVEEEKREMEIKKSREKELMEKLRNCLNFVEKSLIYDNDQDVAQ